MTPESAHDDLAFMKSLVQPGDKFQRDFGRTYFAAGLCYGIQMLLHGAQLAGWSWLQGEAPGLIIGLGPTVVFLGLLVWLARGGNAAPTLANRAIGSVFAAAGVGNLTLIVIVGLSAWREQSLQVWLVYPCAVMVMQGMAWMVAWQIRRYPWFLAISAGWFATALAMAVSIPNLAAFVAITGLGMLAFMLIPGWVMMRRSRVG